MPAFAPIRRVALVVLDGLHADAASHFDLPHLARLAREGASTAHATVPGPALRTAALASVATGVPAGVHGVVTDHWFVPRRRAAELAPLPRVLAAAGLRTSSFVGELPRADLPAAQRLARYLGVADAHFAGRTGPEQVMFARATLHAARRGMIFFHLADARRAARVRGTDSPQYADAVRQTDQTLGLLAALLDIGGDRDTIAVALTLTAQDDAAAARSACSPTRAALCVAGAGVARTELAGASLLDVAPTVLWALGAPVPPAYAGRPLAEAFARRAAAA